MRKWILLAVVVDALLVFGGEFLLRRSRIRKLEQVPEGYQFLLFPGQDTRLYATEDAGDKEPVGTLERAVLASYREIREGMVGVILPDDGRAYARMEDLAFASDHSDRYVSRMRDSWLARRGMDVYYAASKTDGGYSSKLTVVDHRHTRFHTYRYVVDDRRIVVVYEPELGHGLLMALQVMLFVGGLFLILSVSGVVACCRMTSRNGESRHSGAADRETAAPPSRGTTTGEIEPRNCLPIRCDELSSNPR